VREVENSGRVSQEDKEGAIIESIIYSAWYIIIPPFQAPDKMLPGEKVNVCKSTLTLLQPAIMKIPVSIPTVIKLGDSMGNWWWILPLSRCHATSY